MFPNNESLFREMKGSSEYEHVAFRQHTTQTYEERSMTRFNVKIWYWQNVSTLDTTETKTNTTKEIK